MNPLVERPVPTRTIAVRVGAGTARTRSHAATKNAYITSIPQLPRIGRCAHLPSITFIALDESGSITGSNDPIGRRHDEIEVVGRHVACRCGKQLCVVVYFTPGPHDAGPFVLDRRGQALADALNNRPHGTCSNLQPALDVIEPIAAQYPEHERTLIVGTDFELFDANVPVQLQRLIDFPGQCHAMVLNSSTPPALDASPAVTVTRVGWDAPRGAVAHALLPTLARDRR